MTRPSDSTLEGIGPGRLTSEQARELGKRGGRAKANKHKLMDSLGLLHVARDAAFAPYRIAGDALLKAQAGELAKACGGELGPGPSSLLSTWALQMAASRFLFDKGLAGEGNVELIEAGSRIANHARMSLMAAEELAKLTLDRIELNAERERKRQEGGKPEALSAWMEPEG